MVNSMDKQNTENPKMILNGIMNYTFIFITKSIKITKILGAFTSYR